MAKFSSFLKKSILKLNLIPFSIFTIFIFLITLTIPFFVAYYPYYAWINEKIIFNNNLSFILVTTYFFTVGAIMPIIILNSFRKIVKIKERYYRIYTIYG